MNKELKKAFAIKKNSETRRKNDLYASPAIATYVLSKFSNIPSKILEPASGTGHISKILEILGSDVKAYDIEQYENSYFPLNGISNYLELEKQDVEGLVTNPPYKDQLPEKFLQKAIEVDGYKYVAMLCRINFLESEKRYLLFKKFPPSKVVIFSDRITHDNDNLFDVDNDFRGMVCYGWFIWDYRDGKPEQTTLEFAHAKSYKEELKDLLKQHDYIR